MKSLFRHIRTYIFRGLLAIIPLALAFFSVKILYTAIDKRVMGMVEEILGFTFPGLGALLLLAILYVLGLVASNVMGKRIFRFAEGIANRIPLIDSLPGRKTTSSNPFSSRETGVQTCRASGIPQARYVDNRVCDRNNHR